MVILKVQELPMMEPVKPIRSLVVELIFWKYEALKDEITMLVMWVEKVDMRKEVQISQQVLSFIFVLDSNLLIITEDLMEEEVEVIMMLRIMEEAEVELRILEPSIRILYEPRILLILVLL